MMGSSGGRSGGAAGSGEERSEGANEDGPESRISPSIGSDGSTYCEIMTPTRGQLLTCSDIWELNLSPQAGKWPGSFKARFTLNR